MEIGGFERLSLIDYPDKIASVVFTTGCNFRCWFCHNSDLVNRNHKNLLLYSEKKVLTLISNTKHIIEGVTITGGEPTINADLPEFIKKIRDLGLDVKLDTNGSNPNMLMDFIDRKLVNYIAMDVKAPIEKYTDVITINGFEEKVLQSINLLLASDIDYEFRTTIIPQLSKKDILIIAKNVNGAKTYSLQKFNPKNTLSINKFSDVQKWDENMLINLSKEISRLGIVENCYVKNI